MARKQLPIFTIGYEKRTITDFIAALKHAGVEYLADIRERPISRKRDFNAKALNAACEKAGIEYGGWKSLGTPKDLRDQVHESGDFAKFHRTFRAYARKHMGQSLEELAAIATTKTIALMCYERAHEECHRSVIADLLADRLKAAINPIP